MRHGELRSFRGSWFINEFSLKLAYFNTHDTFEAGNWSSHVFLKLVYLTNHDIFNCQATVRLDKHGETCVGLIPIPQLRQVNMVKGKNGETCWQSQPKIPNQITTKTTILNGNGCKNSEKNLVDDRVPEHGDSHASSSHEASVEPILKRREDLCKHSVYTHFPRDRSCEICQRTKITRHRADDALAEPYLVQKILVTW